jgi:hypothetical protein
LPLGAVTGFLVPVTENQSSLQGASGLRLLAVGSGLRQSAQTSLPRLIGTSCGLVRPDGTVSCSVVVSDPTLLPDPTGQAVGLAFLRDQGQPPTPTATPSAGGGAPATLAVVPLLPPLGPPLPPPPPPIVLPPPPPLIVPLGPPGEASGPPAPPAPETPLIPEADGRALLLGGLAALALLARPWRARRKR